MGVVGGVLKLPAFDADCWLRKTREAATRVSPLCARMVDLLKMFLKSKAQPCGCCRTARGRD